MKRITLIIIVLLSFVQFSKAQIIVTSTSASTQKVKKERVKKEWPKSNRVKGWVLRPELELGYDFFDGDFSVDPYLNIGYQLNPYITLGIGGGWNRSSSDITGDGFNVFPVYADIRGYFCNRKASPYLNLKIGYAIGKKSFYNNTDYFEDYDYITEDVQTGFYLGVGCGLNWKNFDFGISIPIVWTRSNYHESYYDYYDYYTLRGARVSLLLHVAYNFQLSSKK
ncbi:MAG: hypothetical protein PHR53_06605 [Bacteroidales bacterium]|nr:hypothetical protein [Bacteroidales bacterium]